MCVNNREESKEPGLLALIARGRLGGIQASKPGSLALIARGRLGGIQASEPGSHLAGGWARHLAC